MLWSLLERGLVKQNERTASWLLTGRGWIVLDAVRKAAK
jgi:hypothetical protein